MVATPFLDSVNEVLMFVVYIIPTPPSMITDTTKHNKTSKSTYVSKEHGVVICVIIYNSLIIIVIIYIYTPICMYHQIIRI